jgi:DNA-binding response OmpR family regulator
MNAKPVILVVDDDLPILTLMRNVLREFGFETREASSGQEALAEVQAQRPDLVLLDKNMPGMSGSEVIDALRSEGGLYGVPILILSGEPVDSEQIARLGAAGAVMKPFDIADLVERIRSHVGVARTSRA